MAEIAGWKTVWTVLSVFLKPLFWGDAMKIESNYLTPIVMNFIIALCMVGTSLVVKGIVGAGFTAFTSSLTPLVAIAMMSAKTKALSVGQKVRGLIK